MHGVGEVPAVAGTVGVLKFASFSSRFFRVSIIISRYVLLGEVNPPSLTVFAPNSTHLQCRILENLRVSCRLEGALEFFLLFLALFEVESSSAHDSLLPRPCACCLQTDVVLTRC